MTEIPSNILGDPPKYVRQSVMSRCIQSSTDATDSDLDADLDVDMDDPTFELPLKAKTRLSRSTNFPDLEPVVSFDKRVRFQSQTTSPWSSTLSEERIGDLEPDYMDVPTPKVISQAHRKPHIEDVIQHAHSLNRYLDQNMDKINSFQSGIYDQEHDNPFPLSHNFASIIATAPTTSSRSVSNFQLSEGDQSDLLEKFQSDHDSISGAILQDDTESEDRKIKQILSSHQTATYPLSENHSTRSLAKDDLKRGPDELHHVPSLVSLRSLANDTTVPCSPEVMNFEFLKPHISLPQRPDTGGDGQEINESPPDMDAQAALELFASTITYILKLSETVEISPEDVTPLFGAFKMKSIPTLGYEQYLQRIHNKFLFAPIVYLTAAHLLQGLILEKRTADDHKLTCKFKIEQSQVHRLIIASVRIATKLLEDCVHSHMYFSRICGISKKLLTKVEVALLQCLQFEGLKITNKSLMNVTKIHQELSEMTK
ncbi:LADA_0G01772g1_1 [Lachancea dasiensis]|uniref:LADA_0G01772g1_1 n=1 Tax=Lachancea dasiensis TaxID=1072105 RepID=A0A1G4JQX6_9SACH|nr:LADA_0G01772g1_1 [Lachancea dasiensis]